MGNPAIENVETRFEKRLTEECGKLKVEIHALRADIIRWMFIFWVGQSATTIRNPVPPTVTRINP